MNEEERAQFLAHKEAVEDALAEVKRKDIQRLFGNLASVFDSSDEAEAPEKKEKVNYAAKLEPLQLLRAAMLCRERQTEGSTDQSLLEADVKAALEEAKYLPEKRWHVRDLLESLCGDAHRYALRYFPLAFRMASPLREVGEGEYYFYLHAAFVYLEYDFEEEAARLLTGLCALSRQRNAPAEHRELVVNLLLWLAEAETPSALSLQLAQAQEDSFSDAEDNDAGNFFWFYGCALEQLQRPAEAAGKFDRCWRIRRAQDGDAHWYTVLARREALLMAYTAERDPGVREALSAVAHQMRQAAFPGVSRESVEIVEGKTLYVFLMPQSAAEADPAYLEDLCRYEALCERYADAGEPCLDRYLARNLRGMYEVARGNHIQAEAAFSEALAEPASPQAEDILPRAQIRLNLLLSYADQNDLDQALPILEELHGQRREALAALGMTGEDYYRIETLWIGIHTQNMLALEPEDAEEARRLLSEACEEIERLAQENGGYRSIAAFVMHAALVEMTMEQAPDLELMRKSLHALERVCAEPERFGYSEVTAAIVRFVAALLADSLDDETAQRLLQETVSDAERFALPAAFKAGAYLGAAMYARGKAAADEEKRYLQAALHEMEERWRACVRYANDQRLNWVLSPAQFQFLTCYCQLCRELPVEERYESVLRFKALASLAARERNRMIQKHNVDDPLLDEIRSLQNRIAEQSPDEISLLANPNADEDQMRLRRLEAEFAARFPDADPFTEITWRKTAEAIPDQSLILEFYYCAAPDEQSPDGTTECFDVFLVRKLDGECRLECFTIPLPDALQEQAEDYLDFLHARSIGQASAAQLMRADSLCAALYDALVRPLEHALCGAGTLYLAPDHFLLNVPLELLHGDGARPLADRFHIVKIECARDFLFPGGGSADGSLIIGGPQYRIQEPEKGESEYREAELSDWEVPPLPFSRMEAEAVARRLGCGFYSGREASKALLLAAKKVRTLHIATHGYFDLEQAENSMYGAGLLMAGVSDWLDGETLEPYGNGMVTADEISRMDLRGAELVVLSSCLSGMNDRTLSRGFHGLVSAMSAAGAHYVITQLWAADDFSTAIFMDAFYSFCSDQTPPPAALNMAKRYLRELTAGELRRAGWLDRATAAADTPLRETHLKRLAALPDHARPFQNEAYWGGFSCYQCY